LLALGVMVCLKFELEGSTANADTDIVGGRMTDVRRPCSAAGLVYRMVDGMSECRHDEIHLRHEFHNAVVERHHVVHAKHSLACFRRHPFNHSPRTVGT
jgi:hypothetical protein